MNTVETETEQTPTVLPAAEPEPEAPPIIAEPPTTETATSITADQASVQAQETQLAKTKVRGLFRIEAIKEEVQWLKALFYGQWGAGKTTLGATADQVPSMKDVLFINAESGTLSLRKEYSHMDAVRISNFSQFARIHEFLRYHCIARDEGDIEKLKKLESIVRGTEIETITAPKVYKTVVIDSLSEVQRYCMMQLLGVQLESISLEYPPDSPVYQQWGQSSEMIQNLVRSFRDLPLNVIFICSQKEEQDDGKRYHYKPNLPGKLAGNVQGFLDVVGYLAMIPEKTVDPNALPTFIRRLFLTPTPYFDAKNRIGNTVQYIDNPTIAKLLAAN